MITDDDFKEIKLKPFKGMASEEHVKFGTPISKRDRVKLFSPTQWEEFTEESIYLIPSYDKVVKVGGAGDMGIDVAGFYSNEKFCGDWDNYQCKHYKDPLQPGDVWTDIGKIIYYSFLKEYSAPKQYFFVCPKGLGSKLQRLIGNPSELKKLTELNWENECAKGITKTKIIDLIGELRDYFDGFNFGIFSSKSVTELLELHQKTPNHAVWFGGGLPLRPCTPEPPDALSDEESRYVKHLLDAYGDSIGKPITDQNILNSYKDFKSDFLTQRKRFYSAEALRNFARDTVPEHTFEELQDEVFNGVIDVCIATEHPNGLVRMRQTMSQAAIISVISNPLAPATKINDRQGICHQLANEDKLKWVLENE